MVWELRFHFDVAISYVPELRTLVIFTLLIVPGAISFPVFITTAAHICWKCRVTGVHVVPLLGLSIKPVYATSKSLCLETSSGVVYLRLVLFTSTVGKIGDSEKMPSSQGAQARKQSCLCPGQ